MDIEIQGPVYDHRLENAGPGKIKFVFIPRKEGTFTLSTKWGGAPVRSVQAIVRTTPQKKQSSSSISAPAGTGRVVLTCKGLLSDVCGEESFFVIDGSDGGSGEPVVSMSRLDKNIPVLCRQVSVVTFCFYLCAHFFRNPAKDPILPPFFTHVFLYIFIGHNGFLIPSHNTENTLISQ